MDCGESFAVTSDSKLLVEVIEAKYDAKHKAPSKPQPIFIAIAVTISIPSSATALTKIS